MVINNYFLLYLELDLDYLERGGDIWRLEVTDSTSREEETSSDSLEQVKIIFLGAPGVGKSSIVKVRNLKIF